LDEIEYQKLAVVEDTMWWFQGLRKNLLGLIERFVSPGGGPILDAGCGTGGVLRALKQVRTAAPLYGIDIFRGAVSATAPTAHVAVASVNAIPFQSGCFKCIFTLDVICQRGVDSTRALQEFHRCLTVGGILIVQVPAYMWLWGYHDVQVHTEHRFTRHELEALLSANGFKICFTTYWNAFLLPLLAIRRKLLPITYAGTDVKRYPPLLDRIFRAVVSLDCMLIRCGFALPFGSSVLIVAEKPADGPS
jgi:SAM-dependent methyltransferase